PTVMSPPSSPSHICPATSFFFPSIRRPPRPTLFPYTTLFRSVPPTTAVPPTIRAPPAPPHPTSPTVPAVTAAAAGTDRRRTSRATPAPRPPATPRPPNRHRGRRPPEVVRCPVGPAAARRSRRAAALPRRVPGRAAAGVRALHRAHRPPADSPAIRPRHLPRHHRPRSARH